MNIIEDYIILGGNDLLSLHAANIAKILDLVVGNVNDKGLLSVLPVIDILIQVRYSHLDNYHVKLNGEWYEPLGFLVYNSSVCAFSPTSFYLDQVLPLVLA